eukprot:COSAG06_NODE_2367_length_7000_cov_16.568179_5_plen_216_part_00
MDLICLAQGRPAARRLVQMVPEPSSLLLLNCPRIRPEPVLANRCVALKTRNSTVAVVFCRCVQVPDPSLRLRCQLAPIMDLFQTTLAPIMDLFQATLAPRMDLICLSCRYPTRRYGGENEHATAAWEILRTTVYNYGGCGERNPIKLSAAFSPTIKLSTGSPGRLLLQAASAATTTARGWSGRCGAHLPAARRRQQRTSPWHGSCWSRPVMTSAR